MNPILAAQQNNMRDINDMPNAPDPADGTDMVDATDTPDSYENTADTYEDTTKSAPADSDAFSDNSEEAFLRTSDNIFSGISKNASKSTSDNFTDASDSSPRNTAPAFTENGTMQIQVVSAFTAIPISGASVTIRESRKENDILHSLITDTSGQTEDLMLPAPPLHYSEEPGEVQPYSEYDVRIEAPGYAPLTVNGSSVFSGQQTIQPAILRPDNSTLWFSPLILIPPNTLFGDFPPKIPEEEIKPMQENDEIVLSRVVVPETIVVHDGVPSNENAANYFVPYKDYIKNVASCEIYSTWPRATLTANILAIMSFTLNRVYTEWYRNRGYDFTITTSTAYDQKYVYGRNIFDSISDVVDEIFTAYISRPGVRQPLFTQYCDGNRVSCPNWLSQWGSKRLGDQGYSAIEILRYYYGESIYINTAEEISGIPFSWPGNNLDIGSSGQKVYQLQEQLNTIATAYPALPAMTVDGIYGEDTKASVRAFQSIFGLPATGIVDYATWFKISDIFVGVSKIAELA